MKLADKRGSTPCGPDCQCKIVTGRIKTSHSEVLNSYQLYRATRRISSFFFT